MLLKIKNSSQRTDLNTSTPEFPGLVLYNFLDKPIATRQVPYSQYVACQDKMLALQKQVDEFNWKYSSMQLLDFEQIMEVPEFAVEIVKVFTAYYNAVRPENFVVAASTHSIPELTPLDLEGLSALAAHEQASCQ